MPRTRPDLGTESITMTYDNSTMYAQMSTFNYPRHIAPIPYKNIKHMYPNFSVEMFSVKIINLRNLSKQHRSCLEPNQIIVDNTTPLGNPFHLPRRDDGSLDEDMRDTILSQYRNYFYDMVRAFGKFGRGLAGLPRDAFLTLKQYSTEVYDGKYSPAQLGFLFMRRLRYIYKALVRYGNIELYCWDVPKHSHAETIVAYLFHFLPQIARSHARYQSRLIHMAQEAIMRDRRLDEDTSETVSMPEEVNEAMRERLHEYSESEDMDEEATMADMESDTDECEATEEDRPVDARGISTSFYE